MRLPRDKKGFTLIELMIVVVIIGILAAIAIPKFNETSKQARMSEADGIMKQICTLEQVYFEKNNAYTTDLTGANTVAGSLATVGWDPSTEGRYYGTFTVAGATWADLKVTAAPKTGVTTVQTKELDCSTGDIVLK